MSDSSTKKGKPDRIRINLHEPYEVHYWKTKFGVSGQQLAGAVRAVGNMVKDVQEYLKQKKKKR